MVRIVRRLGTYEVEGAPDRAELYAALRGMVVALSRQGEDFRSIVMVADSALREAERVAVRRTRGGIWSAPESPSDSGSVVEEQ